MNKPFLIRWLTFSFLFIILLNPLLYGQERGIARVMFYNTENLFDTEDDPDTNDEEFLPEGERHWTNKRLNEKLVKVAKVIIAVGGWEAPEVVGLCEIENLKVLEQLISHTQLKKLGYKIIHKESPDRRGIDVGLLYRENKITPLKYEYLKVIDPENHAFKTREILYFMAEVQYADTLHIFMNHWPSRYGGVLETVDKRALAARVLKEHIEQLKKEYPSPQIVVMGDFNDQPNDNNLVNVLDAKTEIKDIDVGGLYNLSPLWEGNSKGTHKYQSQWSIFDQVMVSGNLLLKDGKIYVNQDDANIFIKPFLLEQDNRYGGVKPNRTFTGFKYNGGFSDHFPVYLDIRKN